MNVFRKGAAAAALAIAAVAVTAAVPASAATDTTPPTVPQNVHQSLAVSANPVITWDASTDVGTGVYHYWVLVDGQQHAKPTATHYDIQTLVNLGRITAGPHVITIQAVDFALNRSAPSAGINIVVVA
jgi:chitinase